jgi:hypothetical protein
MVELTKTSKKKVKITPTPQVKENFYFTIYSFISQHQKLPSNLLSKQALNYYVSRLKTGGFIQRKGYGVWEVLKPYKQVKITPMDSKQVGGKDRIFTSIRGHGFTFRIRLPKIKNWENRITYLQSHKINFKELNKHQRIIYKGHKVWLCNHSIVIYVPKNKDFFSNTAESSQKLAIYHLNNLLESLEHYLGAKFKINGQYQFRVSKQHYAKIKDALAEQCNKDGVKVYCYYNGEGWLVIDNSKGLNELETTNRITSPKDMDKLIIPFMNDLKESYEKTGEIPKLSKQGTIIEQNIADINQLKQDYVMSLKAYTEQINVHLEILNGIKKELPNLTKGINEFRKAIKGFKKK